MSSASVRFSQNKAIVLQKSINYWSYPGGLAGTLDPADFIRMAAEDGFEAAELAIGESGTALGLDVSESKCTELTALAASLGIALPTTASGLYWDRSLGDLDPAKRTKATEDLKTMLRISGWLGAKVHLTIPGAVEVFFLPERPIYAYGEVWKHASEGIAALLPIAEENGVRMGIENVWNKFLMTSGEMKTFLDQFSSPWVGSYLDTGNVLQFGYPEMWITELGNHIAAVHAKDFRKSVGTIEGFVDLLEGDVNWPAVMGALKKTGYSGPLTFEGIPCYNHAPRVRCQNASRAMDAILAM